MRQFVSPILERFNNFAAERFAGVRILALRLAQGLEQTVLVLSAT